jgi:hypothetical protein
MKDKKVIRHAKQREDLELGSLLLLGVVVTISMGVMLFLILA